MIERGLFMLQEERYESILALLEQKKHLTIEQLLDEVPVSLSTIRRDVRALVERSMVKRSRGGISLLVQRKDNGNIPFELRQITNARGKEAIAKKAVTLIKSNDTIYLDGGTTTLQMARFLPKVPLTVITNSLPHVMLILEHHRDNPNLEIYTAGGYVYQPWNVNLGPQARYCLSQYHADLAFLSCRGVDDTGAYNHNEMVVEIERVMIKNSDHIVFLVDHTKLGERSMSFLCELSEINTIITDNLKIHKSLMAKCKENNIRVLETNT
jgi:DeoR/GlpR family transcriptional regulator of sugar metabolism